MADRRLNPVEGETEEKYLERVSGIVPPNEGETEDDYFARVNQMASAEDELPREPQRTYRASPESRRELSMFPPDVRALIERTSQAEFRPEEVLPMLAGGAASFIPIPGAGPMAALAAQGALGGAAALGTESALKGELPTPGRAAAEIGAGGLFGPLGRLFGKGLQFLGE